MTTTEREYKNPADWRRHSRNPDLPRSRRMLRRWLRAQRNLSRDGKLQRWARRNLPTEER